MKSVRIMNFALALDDGKFKGMRGTENQVVL